MNIQILGTGCPKCKLLEENARQAVQTLGTGATIVKVTDLNEIMSFGVMMTPALAVDGKVKSVGRVLSKEQVIEILKKEEK